MNISLRAYSGETDKRQMMSVVHAMMPDSLHVLDMSYRLSSWALDRPDNIGLWVDENDTLVAWAILQMPHWTIDYAYLPTQDISSLLPQLLSWADVRNRERRNTPEERPCWFIYVREGQQQSFIALEEAGFVCQTQASYLGVLLKRPAALAVPSCSLPEGVTLRSFAGESEIDAYVELHRSAFGSKNMTHEWRKRILQSPEYRADLDLVAVDATGRPVAFCICWFSERGIDDKPGGQIEPMGVDNAFHGQGLGRAILAEGLRRLYACGAESVHVHSDTLEGSAKGFYESMGFGIAQHLLVYRKDYPDTP